MVISRQIVVLLDIDDSWGRGTIRGISEYAQAHGNWRLTISPKNDRGELRLPTKWKGDGIISRMTDARFLEHVRQAGLPTVDCGNLTPHEPWFGRVVTNARVRARIAFDHLQGQGLKNFAYFGPPSIRYPKLRGDAFITHVNENGFECSTYEPGYRRDSRISWDRYHQLAADWLQKLPTPIGIMTPDSYTGRQLLSVCEHFGFNVPDKFAIIAGDTDSLMCNVLQPTLSSVLLAPRQLGMTATKMLDELMQGKTPETMFTEIEPLGAIMKMSSDALAITDPELAEAVKLMRREAVNGTNINEILKQIAISRRTLELRFRQAFGRTPAKVIRQIRLDTAKNLLANTNLPITKVAALSGYSKASRLNDVFSQSVGATPSQFRNESRRV